MICGSERLLEVNRTVPADRQQAIGQAQIVFLSNPNEPLANGNCHGDRHALPGEHGQFFRQSVRFSVFDV